MLMAILVLVYQARQQPMKTLKNSKETREIADDVGISFGSCQIIFSNVLGVQNEAAKIVPKLLNFE